MWAMQLSSGKYYEQVRKNVPAALLTSLARWAADERGMADVALVDVVGLRVVPKLEPTDPCCLDIFQRHYRR